MVQPYFAASSFYFHSGCVSIGTTTTASSPDTKLIVDGDTSPVSLMPNANPDNKWVIEATGNYELIVNAAKMTIRLKKL